MSQRPREAKSFVSPTPPGSKKVAMLRPVRGTPGIRLFCIPYAGGNPEIFLPWADYLSPRVELLAVRLPGHGPRIADPPCDQWDALLADILEGLASYLGEPHAFFGHCFGGRLAYELAHLACSAGHAQTKRLFVSACRSPDTQHAGRYVHELPDAEFMEVLRQRGASDEILHNKSVMRYVLPAVRNEIRLAELWNNRHQTAVKVPITAIYATDDDEDGRPRMKGWPAFSTEGCELVEMRGGHFYLEDDPGVLLDVINPRLEQTACKG
jgi:medium-chain acyl-[acyl-carrier-protein] hydrolase